MSDINKVINVEFTEKYANQKGFYSDLQKAVEKQSGKISIAQAIGVIEMFKHELISMNFMQEGD